MHQKSLITLTMKKNNNTLTFLIIGLALVYHRQIKDMIFKNPSSYGEITKANLDAKHVEVNQTFPPTVSDRNIADQIFAIISGAWIFTSADETKIYNLLKVNEKRGSYIFAAYGIRELGLWPFTKSEDLVMVIERLFSASARKTESLQIISG